MRVQQSASARRAVPAAAIAAGRAQVSMVKWAQAKANGIGADEVSGRYSKGKAKVVGNKQQQQQQ